MTDREPAEEDGVWFQWLLVLGVVLMPGLVAVATATASFERAKSVPFCGSCHVMEPFIKDVTDAGGAGLAAKHYGHRWINHNQCYACHTNYDFMGPVDAKWRGLRHIVAYYGGSERPPKLYKPFPNANCLQCHGESRTFLANPAHEPVLPQLRAGEMSCLDCHGPAHPLPGGGHAGQ